MLCEDCARCFSLVFFFRGADAESSRWLEVERGDSGFAFSLSFGLSFSRDLSFSLFFCLRSEVHTFAMLGYSRVFAHFHERMPKVVRILGMRMKVIA